MSHLYSAMIIHSSTPRDLLSATVALLSKAKCGNLCDNTSVVKILDLISIHRYAWSLETSYLQFAFKQDHSTVMIMCNLALRETMNYYLNKSSDVFYCMLHAIKAFYFNAYRVFFMYHG